jgi:hypothetical protein
MNHCLFQFYFRLSFKGLFFTEITDLLQPRVNVRKSSCQPQCTLQYLREDGVLFS